MQIQKEFDPNVHLRRSYIKFLMQIQHVYVCNGNCNQVIIYKSRGTWDICLEQNLRFGLVLGWLAVLKTAQSKTLLRIKLKKENINFQ